MLGRLGLTGGNADRLTALLAQPKRIALLSYLALARPRGFQSKDTILALYWPDLDDRHARWALNQAVRYLRRALGPAAVVSRGQNDVGLDAAHVRCDAVAFEVACEARRWDEATAAYTGELLPGLRPGGSAELDQWLEAERDRLQHLAARAASARSEELVAGGDFIGAAEFARQAARLVPDDETGVRRLIELLNAAGDRAGAAQAYENYASWLRHELDLEPAPETQAVIQAVRTGDGSRVAVTPRPLPHWPSPRDTPAPSAIATGGLGGSPRRRWRRALVALASVALLSAILLLRPARRSLSPTEAPPDRTAIAVLPFDNLTADGAYGYLARGLQDEILTQLSKVGPIRVISRISVMTYVGPNIPPLRRIAKELGVGSVVEGSVQAVDGRLRVNVQLIDAATGRQLWAEQYDRSLADVFAIESDVAQRIVQSVGAVLSVAERQGLARAPTANPEAYQFYLQGRDYLVRPNHLRGDYEIAGHLLEHALALDSRFALAHATLSLVDGEMYEDRYDPSPQRAAHQLREAQSAVRLAPDMPEAYLAMGVAHEYVARDYAAALADYRRALAGMPNDAGVWAHIAYVLPRMGRWDEAIAAYERAEQLNPRDATLSYIGGALSYLRLHRFAEAVRAFDRALALAPDLYSAAVRRAHTFVLWRGQLDTLRAVINRIPKDAELFAFGPTAVWHLQLMLWERQPDSVPEVVHAARLKVFESYYVFYPASLYSAWALQLRGNWAAARAAFDSSRVMLDSVIKDLPEDWRVHAARGLALAGLGRRDEALREARWLQQSFRYREDALDRPTLAEERARILAQAGESAAALREIEQLLAAPSLLTVHTLRLDPLWDPLRSNRRFQALLVKYARTSRN